MVEPGCNNEDVLSIGVVGAGEIVTRVHLPVLSACAGVRVAYVADTNREAAAIAARSVGGAAIVVADGSIDELPQTEVVLLAVPVSVRMPYYERFARRGTCVLAEKPLATGLAEAERICRLYPEHALGCGFQRRTYATARLARRLVAENWFGPLRSMSVSEGALTTKTGTDARFYDESGSGGGVLMDLGCHSLDLALWISGAQKFAIANQRFVFDGDVDREVEARILLQAPSGTCELDYFVTWLRPTDNLINLHFDNCVATLSCRPAKHIEIRGLGRNAASATASAEDGATTVYQAFYLEWMAFLDAVRKSEASEFNALNALTTVAAVEALYQAAGQQV